MATLSYLRALHSVIGAALDDLDRVYGNYSLDFPSPDTPFYQNNPPSDQSDNLKAAQGLRDDRVVVKACNNIVAACGQLASAIQNPTLTLLEGVSSCHVTASLKFAEESNAVEILRAAGPSGLHVRDLALRIDEIRAGNGPVSYPLEPSRLSHILRLLATHGWFREVSPDVFVNNRLSSLLDSGKTPDQLRESPLTKYDDTNGIPAVVPMSTNETFRSIVYLSEWLLAPRPGANIETLFNYVYQTSDNFYQWVERPENAFRLKQISRAMSAAGTIEGKSDITAKFVFPWDTLAPGSVVVDVGGGIGSVSVKLALAYPHLRFVVQDRAQTVAMGPVLLAKHKDLFDSGRITYQVQDFFEPQPDSVKGHAAVFLLTRVMHNWDDARCKQILSRLREAAKPESRLIIVDQVLPFACRDPSASATGVDEPRVPEGSPLLPNLGKAFVAGYHFDITMLATFNSKERTLHEYTALADATGWKIAHVARSEGGVSGFTTLAPV